MIYQTKEQREQITVLTKEDLGLLPEPMDKPDTRPPLNRAHVDLQVAGVQAFLAEERNKKNADRRKSETN